MSNIDSIQEYMRRMYQSEEGSVEEIFNALFTEDVVFNVGEDKVIPREAFMQAAQGLRSMPASARVVEVSDFREEGDQVMFRMYTRMPNAETGEPMEIDSNSVWRFNAEGMVVETRPVSSNMNPDDIDTAFRSMGVDG